MGKLLASLLNVRHINLIPSINPVTLLSISLPVPILQATSGLLHQIGHTVIIENTIHRRPHVLATDKSVLGHFSSISQLVFIRVIRSAATGVHKCIRANVPFYFNSMHSSSISIIVRPTSFQSLAKAFASAQLRSTR